jgi:sigma-54 dependent transcriptional regulator, acetoin dehydrogenase operon transcriptional activator AcoR
VRVEARHLPDDLAAQLPDLPGAARRTEETDADAVARERERIVAVLRAHHWRPNAAALALGISRATLYRRIAKLGIVAPHRL